MNNFLKTTWKNGMYFLFALFLTTGLLSAKCASQEKQKTSFERDSIIAAGWEIMGSQKYCALVTIDSLGTPHICTINPFPPEDDMTVWMATNSRSDKAQQLGKRMLKNHLELNVVFHSQFTITSVEVERAPSIS